MSGTDKRRIIVKCSRCQSEYSANRQHYLSSQLKGNPNFCPACLSQIRYGNAKKTAKILATNKGEMAEEFMAPCRMKIVPEEEGPRARCKPTFRKYGCPEYSVCHDFACKNNWDGWRVAE